MAPSAASGGPLSMTALPIVLSLMALALATVWIAGLRGVALAITGLALLLGSAVYRIQQRQPMVAAVHRPPPVSLVTRRNALIGSFNAANNWMIIADSFAARGKTEEAAGVLLSAVRAHPRDYALWMALGTALTDYTHRLDPAARLAFARSAALAPASPAPGYFLGRAMLQSGDVDGALTQWRTILAAAPAEASWRPIVEDDISTVAGQRRR